MVAEVYESHLLKGKEGVGGLAADKGMKVLNLQEGTVQGKVSRAQVKVCICGHSKMLVTDVGEESLLVSLENTLVVGLVSVKQKVYRRCRMWVRKGTMKRRRRP